MAIKISKLQDMVGKEATLIMKDRYDSEYYANILQIDQLGVLFSYSDHGREFTSFIPLHNLDSIDYKHVADTK